MSADRCNLNSFAKPFVNGTDGREACAKCWVAALVHTNCEKRVAANLDKLGIENYAAVQTEEHQWSDRKKKIDRIVIPMIVFVRLAQDEVEEFRRLSFILKFITYPGSKELATPIPDEQIEKLKFLLHNADAGELSHIEANKPVVAIRIDGLGLCLRKCGES